MKLLLIAIMMYSTSIMAFGLKLDASPTPSPLCVPKNISLKGCCSHHKGISQCGLGLINIDSNGHVKCTDGFKSSCKIVKK